MARIRTVKPEFFQHEELGALPFAARLLAIGLMQLADGHGRLRWIPKQIEAHVFPWDDVDLEVLAVGLESAGILLRYQVGVRGFACFPNFRKHQRITGKELELASKHPSPDDASAGEVNPRGNSGETPGCFPGKHLDAQEQGTGEQGTGEQGTGNKEQETIVASEAATMVADAPSLSPAQEVWEHYLSRRSRRSRMPASAAEQIRARIRSTSVESCKLVVDWSHDAPSAAHLRDNDRNRDFTRWSTIFARRNFDKYVEEAHEWDDAGRSKQAPQPSQPEPERPYQDWSWFESQLRARADDLAMTPEQITPEWARKHREWHTVPGWVFDRALEATKEHRSARY